MIFINGDSYIYRVDHRIMEGDCQYDHGPYVVNLKDFYIDKYPVTNADFQNFLNESGYSPEDKNNFLKHFIKGICPEHLLDHPVTWVSHNDAKAYCNFYDKRLPTDVEWQYVAGGVNQNKWPWGNEFIATYCNGNGVQTTPITFHKENESCFGCCDMCGNTYEWVNDIKDDSQHLFTFLRGGSYYSAPHFWHAEGGPKPNDFHLKFQLLNEGLNRSSSIGFRCVKEV